MKKALVLISKSLVSYVLFNWSYKFEDVSGKPSLCKGITETDFS